MRDLLVHVTRYPEWDTGVTYAARFAASMHASLTGLAVVPLADVPMPYYDGGLVMAQYAAFLDAQLQAARAVAPGFSAWASSLGVAHSSWIAAQGQAVALLHHVGHWHDLVVLGAGGEDPWSAPGGIAAIVLGCGLPCLVVPPSAMPVEMRGAPVAVAWNGSLEAIRALHSALPLLQAAGRVSLLVGPPKPQSSLLPEFSLDAWCRRHGLRTEVLRLDEGADDGEAILAAVHAAGAQLLVMGAYGRSRLSEWVLGGVTRHMLHHADLPLLLRH